MFLTYSDSWCARLYLSSFVSSSVPYIAVHFSDLQPSCYVLDATALCVKVQLGSRTGQSSRLDRVLLCAWTRWMDVDSTVAPAAVQRTSDCTRHLICSIQPWDSVMRSGALFAMLWEMLGQQRIGLHDTSDAMCPWASNFRNFFWTLELNQEQSSGFFYGIPGLPSPIWPSLHTYIMSPDFPWGFPNKVWNVEYLFISSRAPCKSKELRICTETGCSGQWLQVWRTEDIA